MSFVRHAPVAFHCTRQSLGALLRCPAVSFSSTAHTLPLSGISTNLSSARVMWPDDTNCNGNVHGGTILRLMEEAGFIIASRFCNVQHTPEEEEELVPVMAHLAQLHKMNFLKPMHVGELAKFYAKPTFTSRHSVEVAVEACAENIITGEMRVTNQAILSYVAVNAETGSCLDSAILQLVPQSTMEKQCFAEGLARYHSRSRSIPKPPSQGLSVAHCSTVILQQLAMPADCHHGKVVSGGVIMRMMDSTAALCAAKYCGAGVNNVVTVSIDGLNFYEKVWLLDVTHVSAKVINTSSKSMLIEVTVEVERPGTGERILTTDGTFTFLFLNDEGRPRAVPQLVPEVDEELVLTVDGVQDDEDGFNSGFFGTKILLGGLSTADLHEAYSL